MTSAGVGVAVHLDGFTAAGLAAHRALAAAGTRAAKVAIVFAGIKHDDDEYAGVLSAVRRTLPGAAIIGCSATGVPRMSRVVSATGSGMNRSICVLASSRVCSTNRTGSAGRVDARLPVRAVLQGLRHRLGPAASPRPARCPAVVPVAA